MFLKSCFLFAFLAATVKSEKADDCNFFEKAIEINLNVDMNPLKLLIFSPKEN